LDTAGCPWQVAVNLPYEELMVNPAPNPALVATIAGIAGAVSALVVTFINNHLQIRREYRRIAQDKSELVCAKITYITSACYKFMNHSLNISEVEEAKEFLSLLKKGDVNFETQKSINDLTSLVRIYFSNSNDRCDDFRKTANDFLRQIESYGADILHEVSERRGVYYSRDIPEHIHTLSELLKNGGILQDAVIQDLEYLLKCGFPAGRNLTSDKGIKCPWCLWLPAGVRNSLLRLWADLKSIR
jgi:hypothetical protein